MKKIVSVIALHFLLSNAWAQDVAIIPQAVSVHRSSGLFALKNNFSIGMSATDLDTRRVADYLSKKISVPSGFAFEIGKLKRENTIRFHLLNARAKNSELGKEGYLLNIYTD